MACILLEAIPAGFRHAWQAQNYAMIVDVAKIQANVLQEDPKLLMWYGQAAVRLSRRRPEEYGEPDVAGCGGGGAASVLWR